MSGNGEATRRQALIGAGASLILPARALAQDSLTNLMPAFWRAYDAASVLEMEPRARAILDNYFFPHVAFYRGAGLGRVDLARWLLVFDPIAAQVRGLSDGFPALWRDHAARFARALPDFDTATPVHLLVSFLQFDAHARLWQGRLALFIGLDGVVQFHGPGADLRVLLAHECFHLYHHQVNPALWGPTGDPLWLGIWREGLAVHASAVLNPAATLRAVLLGEAALAEADPAVLRRIASEVLPLLEDASPTLRARFLGYGFRGDIPARSGYFLGMLAAELFSTPRDLAVLARLPASEARALVVRALTRLSAP